MVSLVDICEAFLFLAFLPLSEKCTHDKIATTLTLLHTIQSAKIIDKRENLSCTRDIEQQQAAAAGGLRWAGGVADTDTAAG